MSWGALQAGCLAAFIARPGKVLYPLGPKPDIDVFGLAYSVRQVAEKLGVALGRSIQIVDIPPAGHVAALTQAGIPQQVAEAVAEMFAAFSAGLLVPQGDRHLVGTTTIDEVIAKYLRDHRTAERSQ